MVAILITLAVASMVSIALAVWLRPQLIQLHGSMERAEGLIGVKHTGGFLTRASQIIVAMEQALQSSAPRAQSHAISGLPTREPLIARMKSDRKGTLGILALKDYDRLCAFDPESAERLLLIMVERLTAMVPRDQLVAQLDRSHLAIWIGPDFQFDLQ